MNNLRKCKECGAEFTPRTIKQKFCCRKCQLKSNKREANRRIRKFHAEEKKVPCKSNVVDVARMAKAAGMTYGKYVAMLYAQEMQKGKR